MYKLPKFTSRFKIPLLWVFITIPIIVIFFNLFYLGNPIPKGKIVESESGTQEGIEDKRIFTTPITPITPITPVTAITTTKIVSKEQFIGNANIDNGVIELLEQAKSASPEDTKRIATEINLLKKTKKDHAQELARLFGLGGNNNQRREYIDKELTKNLEAVIYHWDEKTKKYFPIPLIKVTHDLNASISSDSLNLDTIESITAYSFKVGVWDSGSTRVTHQEIRGRARQMDTGNLSEHATRVSGVIASIGVTNTAKAISSLVSIDCYNWDNDISELVADATSTNNPTANIPISNHSYNYSSGWYLSSGVWVFIGHYTMGQYNAGVEEVDSLLHSRPYLTMVRSAGNDRTENPRSGENVRPDFWSSQTVAYNSAIHPPGDGVHKGGFDTISYAALAKNTITVGAVNDAVTSGNRDLAKATLTTYTSWGPTDDGRIKPDIVANGSSLVAPTSSSDTAYSSLSGTSAASPVVSSIAALLTQYWINTQNPIPGNPAIAGLKSSTLKALLIHGADDLGNPGPDYKFGWGLANGKKSLNIIKANNLNPENKVIQELNFQSQHIDEFYWDKSSEIVATICWTDPKGQRISVEDSSTPTLVNDLDIVLIDPNGNHHFPFVMPFTTQRTLESMNFPATTGINSTDNVEMVKIKTPLSGKYRLLITSKTAINPSSPQEYCLIVTGVQKSNPDPDPNPDPNPSSYEAWANVIFGENWEDLPSTNPNDDFDNDGLNNWSEFNLNSNPTDPLSALKLKILEIESNNNIKSITLRVGPIPKAGNLEVISKTNLLSPAWDGPRISIPTLPPILEGNNNSDSKDILNQAPAYTEVMITSEEEQLFFQLQYTSPQL